MKLALLSFFLSLLPVHSAQAFLGTTEKYWIGPKMDLSTAWISLETKQHDEIYETFLREQSSAQGVPGIDFHLMMELNHDAAELWKRLVACSGGDSDQARHHYQFAEFPCEGKKAKKEPGLLQNELRQFHTRVLQFITSSRFGDRDFDRGTQEARLPSIHPLLAQVIFDNLTQEKIFYAVDKALGVAASVYVSDAKRIRNMSLFYVMFFPLNRCEEMGLWPTYNAFLLGELEQGSSAGFFINYDGEKLENFLDRYQTGKGHDMGWFSASVSILCRGKGNEPAGGASKLAMQGNHLGLCYSWDLARMFRAIGKQYR